MDETSGKKMMKESRRGKYIVITGGEGSGKSTLIKDFLVPKFGMKEFFWTREPGGTSFGEKIRGLILAPETKNKPTLTHFFLHFAARADHVALIAQKGAEGTNIISDRGDCCTFAYQIYGQEGYDLEDFFWQTREIVFKSIEPDLYIFLDILPEIGLARIKERGEKKTYYDEQALDFHQRVRKGFKIFMKKVPSTTIDASKSKEEVASKAIKIIENVLAK